MENERPIEKLLRRFAKQRREDSDANVKLHPATRRLLQGEVARQFPKVADKAKSSTSAFTAFRAKLAYGLCAIAVVAVIGAIVFPALNRAKSTVHLAKMESQTPAESGALERRSQPVAPAASPVVVGDIEVSGSGRLETDDASITERETAASEPQRAMPASTATAALANGKVISEELKKPAAAGSSFQYADRQRRDVALFSNTGNIQTRAAVLNSFQVEQVGSELRVTDEDGSTYSGNILAADVPAPSTPQLATGGSGGGGGGKSAIAEQPADKDKQFKATSGSDQVSQQLFFRVSGFNNTLRQNVVFEGNLIPTNQTLPSQANATAQSPQQIQNFQQFINNSVIIGRAQVEKEREIEINATPVGP